MSYGVASLMQEKDLQSSLPYKLYDTSIIVILANFATVQLDAVRKIIDVRW